MYKSQERREILILALVPGTVLTLILASWLIEMWGVLPPLVSSALAIIATLFGGLQRFITGFRDIVNRKITVNVFVAVALIATLAVGEFRAAAIIVFIMAVAGGLETFALGKNRKSITDLLDLSPLMATVMTDDGEVVVPVAQLREGDIVAVRPGERIPVDGTVVGGSSSVNQAPITGESMPVEKAKGHDVFSGTLSETGYLEIRTSKTGDDTTLARIVHLVEEAQHARAPVQNIADRFTVWFLPAVLVLAAISFITSGDIKVAVSVLLVACPCAFAIATPTAVTAGISNMARRAVLVKGGIFFELAGKIDTLVVDKTGTLTLGRPQVAEVVGFGGVSSQHVLRMAAAVEKYSEHPLARAIMSHADRHGIEVPDPDDFKVQAGMGASATLANERVLVGRPEFLRTEGLPMSPATEEALSQQEKQGRTAFLVACNAQVIGVIGLADEIRPETAAGIAALRKLGIKKITMLTGDNAEAAESVARQIGVDDFRAGLLPEQKQEYIRQVQKELHIVGMVGDGINDAPSLGIADVGMVMGAAGTDLAIETADVVLMNDNLLRIADFVSISRKVLGRIKLNIFLSIIYNIIGLSLAGFGLLSPVMAVLFQEAGCVSVVLSSILLLWARPDHIGLR